MKRLKKYFIPHEENEHQPHILRPRTVAFVILIAIVVESVFLFGSSFVAPRSKLFGIILTNALIDGTNAARSANGLSGLKTNSLLQAAAQEKANDMVKNDYFAHTSPAGVTPWHWFQDVGYNFFAAGENLAVNFSDSADVTKAWMNSPAHRQNILNNGFTEIGIATAQGEFQGRQAIYVVEFFGAPAVSFALAPPSTSGLSAVAPRAPVVPVASKQTPAVVPKLATLTQTSTEIFAVVKGAEVGTIPQTTGAAPIAVAKQNNVIQRAAADPRHVVDYFYFALLIIFAVALALNVFIKLRVQHPQLILSGMLVIAVAGLFIALNHQVLITSSAIL